MTGLPRDRLPHRGKLILRLLQSVIQRQVFLLLPDLKLQLPAFCRTLLRRAVTLRSPLHFRRQLLELLPVVLKFLLLLADPADVADQLVFLLDLLIQRRDLPVQRIQCRLILKSELSQYLQPFSNPPVKLLLAEPAHFLRYGRILRALDPVHILADAALELIVLRLLCSGGVL